MTERRPPNFLVVLCDDLGYGDVGLYGPCPIPTPRIEEMAREGVVLTDYYAPANICTPSRAGLLTGRYPVRTGLGFEVIMQQDDRGLPLSEVTVARALKPAYASGLFGKWHLGHRGDAWPPTRHGFDAFFGIPYSHDMSPLALFDAAADRDEVAEFPADLATLQQAFLERALDFIEDHRAQPFFVELALSAPHLPAHPCPPHDVAGPGGPYGAVVREIDNIVGRMLDHIRRLGMTEDTIVVFTSDNGPWFEGSAGWLRDRKGGAAYDGGYRVPFVAWAPGRLPAGKRTDSIAMGIDLLPTFLSFAGLPPPAGVTLDGRDISDVLLYGAPSPHEALILFDNEVPVGVRTQDWKYVVSAYYRGMKMPLAPWGDQLFDTKTDPSENYSVAAAHPEVIAEMKAHLARARETFAPFRQKEMPPVFRRMRDYVAHMQD
ncbi:MAG TPA: sulfatase-like hydrolase/transferase [Caulobacteraceae bacterium]|nr:sulfatase-like hydrolase/transferase [Caulobacteraceae bacterium]